MIFFSGFGFQREYEIFNDYIIKSDFNIAGFNYGAIIAFEEAIKSRDRVDTLQLFSPIFFQDRSENFKSKQLKKYKNSRDKYLFNYYKDAVYPSKLDIEKYKNRTNIEELDKLLHYIWEEEKIKKLIDSGIKIEVFLGKLDKIVNAKEAYNFFINFTTIYWFNNSGHIISYIEKESQNGCKNRYINSFR